MFSSWMANALSIHSKPINTFLVGGIFMRVSHFFIGLLTVFFAVGAYANASYSAGVDQLRLSTHSLHGHSDGVVYDQASTDTAASSGYNPTTSTWQVTHANAEHGLLKSSSSTITDGSANATATVSNPDPGHVVQAYVQGDVVGDGSVGSSLSLNDGGVVTFHLAPQTEFDVDGWLFSESSIISALQTAMSNADFTLTLGSGHDEQSETAFVQTSVTGSSKSFSQDNALEMMLDVVNRSNCWMTGTFSFGVNGMAVSPSTVPEAPVPAMMAAGLLLVGFKLRRRQS